jgi:hypothetical protein
MRGERVIDAKNEGVTPNAFCESAVPLGAETMRHIIPFVCLLIVSCQSAITHVNYVLARDTTRVQIAERRQVSGCKRIGVITASDGRSSATDENVSFGSRERALRRLKQKALIHHGDTLVVEPGEIVRTTSHSEGEEVFVSGTVFQCRENRAPTTTAPN